VAVLQTAVAINPADANALYYLGNYWYDKRQYADAIDCWEKSALIQQAFPTVHRNLALAYFNKEGKKDKALAAMELAFSLDESDARVLMELDQLYKALNKPLAERLVLLEKHLPLVCSREDLYLERITICNQLGQHEKASGLIAAFKFHPWEGGEGKVICQYLYCQLELTKIAIAAGRYNDALQLLNVLEHYPINLGEGKLPGTQENDIDYWKGVVYECMDEQDSALNFFKRATNGISEPVQAIFYNDPQPDKIFYQGLAWLKLGDSEKANDIFNRLINFGKQHMDDKISIDYFAVSLPDLLVFDADLNLLNKIHCLYLSGLGSLGLGKENTEKAAAYFDAVLAFNNSHQGALIHKKMISTQYHAKHAG
jgi:tetratricopeptide (TPR) repeat protein